MKHTSGALIPDMPSPTLNNCDHQWFVATLKPNAYAKAKLNLEQQGFPTFMPLEVHQVRHARKTREVHRPLFPGYIFVAFDPNVTRWHVINNTRGVTGLIMLGANAPQRVPRGLMKAMLSECNEIGQIIPPTIFEQGAKVRVLHGPFTDVIAEVKKASQGDRVWLLVELLGRSVVTECAGTSLRYHSA